MAYQWRIIILSVHFKLRSYPCWHYCLVHIACVKVNPISELNHDTRAIVKI